MKMLSHKSFFKESSIAPFSGPSIAEGIKERVIFFQTELIRLFNWEFGIRVMRACINWQ